MWKKEKDSGRGDGKLKAMDDQYVGLFLLPIYILLTYFGTVQRKESPFFEDYIASITSHIEGAGAVFGYLMSAPVVEALMASLSSVSLVAVLFISRLIFLKWTSVIGKRILTVLIVLLCSYGIVATLGEILMFGRWRFGILMLAQWSFLLYLTYFVYYSLWIQKRSGHIES